MNEKAVGRAIKKSGVPRKDIFLETKLWPSFYENEDAVEKTLERLDTDYIDLLLIHQPAGNYIAGYRLMEKAYKEGKVKAIGLSNFTKEGVQEILGICEVKPTVLQTVPLPITGYSPKSRQGESRTHNVYHEGHSFTDCLLQPFAYLPLIIFSSHIIIVWHISHLLYIS